MPVYRRRPGTIEALRFFAGQARAGFLAETVCRCREWVDADLRSVFHVHSKEGVRLLRDGDWVLRDANGGFYVWPHQVFAGTWEEVRDPV